MEPAGASRTQRRWPLWHVLALVGASLLLFPLYLFDPESTPGFLPCPLHWATGLLCPGCGAQRALHDLLHGRFGEAFGHNAMLVLSIPLLGLQWALPKFIRSMKDPASDNRIVLIWLLLLLGWAFARNTLPGLHPH